MHGLCCLAMRDEDQPSQCSLVNQTPSCPPFYKFASMGKEV